MRCLSERPSDTVNNSPSNTIATLSKELNALVATISERVARYLERQGWLARDKRSDHLTLAWEDEEGATLQQLQGHSITYRIAMGPHAGPAHC